MQVRSVHRGTYTNLDTAIAEEKNYRRGERQDLACGDAKSSIYFCKDTPSQGRGEEKSMAKSSQIVTEVYSRFLFFTCGQSEGPGRYLM